MTAALCKAKGEEQKGASSESVESCFLCSKPPFAHRSPLHYSVCKICTVKSRFNESRVNVKSRFKAQILVTKVEFHIKKSRFSEKSRFKESKCADRDHPFVKFRLYCTAKMSAYAKSIIAGFKSFTFLPSCVTVNIG